MTRRFWLGSVVFAIALSVSMAAFAETLESVEQKIQGLWGNTDSFSAKVEMTSDMGQAPMAMKMTANGTIECMKKGEIFLNRTEMVNKMHMGDSVMESKMLSVFDGEWVYVQMDMMGMPVMSKQKPDIKSGTVYGSGETFFKNLHETFDVELLADEEVDGVATYVLGLTKKEEDSKPAAPGGTPEFSKAKWYFAKETGFQQKMEMLDGSGKPVMTMKFKEFKINPEIDPGRFKYVKPEGVRDMSELQGMMQPPAGAN